LIVAFESGAERVDAAFHESPQATNQFPRVRVVKGIMPSNQHRSSLDAPIAESDDLCTGVYGLHFFFFADSAAILAASASRRAVTWAASRASQTVIGRFPS
jgi:hypothetical protein